jgi:hypothetical protein
MIAGGEHIAAQFKKFFGKSGRQPKASGSVLGIGNDQINFVGLDKVGQVVAKDFAPRVAKDIANEKDLHRT